MIKVGKSSLAKNFMIKSIIIVVFILMLIPALAGCDMLEEDEEIEHVYLTVELENPYAVEILNPAPGRYKYEEGAVVDIELVENEGWNFLGWQGEDGDEVAARDKDAGKYSLVVSEDRAIEAELELKEFLGLKIDFDGVGAVDFAEHAGPGGEVTDVPHNIEYIMLEFNNRLHENVVEDLVVEMINDEANDGNDKENEEENDEENEEQLIDSDNIAVEENYLIITIRDWRDRWFFGDEEDYLEFGKEYSLLIDNSDEYIFDADSLKRIEPEKIEIDFVIEQPYPESPADVNAEILNDRIEVRWLRSEKNAEVDMEEYAENYRVYRSSNQEDLEGVRDSEEIDKDQVEVFDLNVEEDLEGEKVLRYEDSEVELEEEDYYYRVSAYNEIKGEIYESLLSELVGEE